MKARNSFAFLYLSIAVTFNPSVAKAASSLFRTNPQVTGKTDNEVILSYWLDNSVHSISLPIAESEVGQTNKNTPFSWKDIALEDLMRFSRASFYREMDSSFGGQIRIDVAHVAMVIYLPTGERAFFDWKGNPFNRSYQFQDKTKLKFEGIPHSSMNRITPTARNGEGNEYLRTGFILHNPTKSTPNTTWLSFSDQFTYHSLERISSFLRTSGGHSTTVDYFSNGVSWGRYDTARRPFFRPSENRVSNIEVEEVYETSDTTGYESRYWILARKSGENDGRRTLYVAHPDTPNILAVVELTMGLRVEYAGKTLIYSFAQSNGTRSYYEVDHRGVSKSLSLELVDPTAPEQVRRNSLDLLNTLTSPAQANRVRFRNQKMITFVRELDRQRARCEKKLK